MKRTYTDVNGVKRTLTLLEPVNGLVDWHSDLPANAATRWLTEDGRSVIQIPDNAWEMYNIEFEELE